MLDSTCKGLGFSRFGFGSTPVWLDSTNIGRCRPDVGRLWPKGRWSQARQGNLAGGSTAQSSLRSIAPHVCMQPMHAHAFWQGMPRFAHHPQYVVKPRKPQKFYSVMQWFPQSSRIWLILPSTWRCCDNALKSFVRMGCPVVALVFSTRSRFGLFLAPRRPLHGCNLCGHDGSRGFYVH